MCLICVHILDVKFVNYAQILYVKLFETCFHILDFKLIFGIVHILDVNRCFRNVFKKNDAKFNV